MDYQLENLGPEKFQHLCQSLVLKEFPNTQCLPVAQPDGGRDAISYVSSSKDFLVFQVKFVRKPLAVTDIHKWLEEIVEEEAPKIKKIMPRGAARFVLLTNVPGTAHLDVGTIDKVNKILKDNFDIPAHCWWRDDLNRRLDVSYDLKWVYPEIMSGPDMIRAILETGLTEKKEQRIDALKAFIREQHDIDLEVRFKQVELQNQLLDLFIDVPLTKNRYFYSGNTGYYFNQAIRDIQKSHINEIDESEFTYYQSGGYRYLDSYGTNNIPVGAASFLLNPIIQKKIPYLVLEGAPGQGKSTITQYVCQIHRMRILNESFEKIPDNHILESVRIPFKIDLRDLATWLGKKNPFSSEENDSFLQYWHKSLESFLAAQVRHHSGGANFNVEDLTAISKYSAILLVFDGLDEVADISRRQDVVEELIRGINRINENAVSLQVIVTSRPAAFANSPGLPADKFPYLHLDSVTKPLIEQYANKWLKARKIYGRESAEFKRILKDKIDQPHLRDLARNPMQLAILLSLILTRGSSLPDKRTALYDSYIELFLSRESEKSSVVRDHRDLLIDIHRYIAWVLHSESELGEDEESISVPGSITVERLQKLLFDYLQTEGHDPSLSTTLFSGMIERVFVLVSRLQGTFEFEVQPLREYFAARFLYDTAPYSPPGNEKTGTKPDRFDAIARNFYWLNVTRFFAGCFSKGELPTLVDRLEELINEEGYKFTTHPRVLAATLLSDWVFTQNQKSVKETINLVIDGLGLRFILAPTNLRSNSPALITLPDKCGRRDLINRCFDILDGHPPLDYALDLTELLKANASVKELSENWVERAIKGKSNIVRWVKYGLYLGVLANIDLANLEKVVASQTDTETNEKIYLIAFQAKRFDFIETAQEKSDIIINKHLDALNPYIVRRPQQFLDMFCFFLNPGNFSASFVNRHRIALNDLLSRRYDLPKNLLPKKTNGISSILFEKCLKFIEKVNTELNRSSEEWATNLSPWDNIVEELRAVWGERRVNVFFANVAAGIKSSSETYTEYSDLLDNSKSLCRRVRYARLRAGNPSWWSDQIKKVKSTEDTFLTLMVLLTWGSGSTLTALAKKVDYLLNSLNEFDWNHLISLVKQSISFTQVQLNKGLVQIDADSLSDTLSERTVAAFIGRAKEPYSQAIYNKYLDNYKGNDYSILETCRFYSLKLNNITSTSWEPNLELITKWYKKDIMFPLDSTGNTVLSSNIKSFPKEIAEEIAGHPDQYPSQLVAFAESRWKDFVAQRIKPVAKIAGEEKWFQ